MFFETLLCVSFRLSATLLATNLHQHTQISSQKCGTRDKSTLCGTMVLLMTIDRLRVLTLFRFVRVFLCARSHADHLCAAYPSKCLPPAMWHFSSLCAKSRWNAGSHRDESCRPGAGHPRGAPLVYRSEAGACLGWPSTGDNFTCWDPRCSVAPQATPRYSACSTE